MTDKEKIAFLKKMGISGSVVSDASIKQKKEKKDLRVDRSELINLARKFDVIPKGKKQESLAEFLDKDQE